MSDWVLATEESGYTRRFDAEALPVAIGGDAGADLVLGNVQGSIQIGLLDGIYFVQPGKNTDNVRLDGELLRGSRRLADGSVIALDTARLTCRLTGGRLTLAIEAQITAGDTAPPDFDALAHEDSSAVTVDPIAFRRDQREERSRVSKRMRITSLIVYAAFVVLATLGWFAFTAKSVEFDFTPPAEVVELPDTWFKFELGGRYLLRRGEHTLVATRDGYYPIEQDVSVGVLQDQTIALEFTRLPGLITFATRPEAEAEVKVDGEVIGTTPLSDVEIRPGTHQVQFTAERYLSEQLALEVEGGHERQTLTAELTPSWAPVTLSSDPPGAEILVDGRVLGVTPNELELTAGEREIELSLAGYNGWRREVRVVADEPQELPLVRLELADGRVALATTPADASVNVNGEYVGRTPNELRLRPNVEHELTIFKPGYETVNRSLVLAPGSRQNLALELEERLGTVEVSSMPSGATVLVNGERRGVTPLSLELMAIRQDIEVSLDGYAPAEDSLTPRPGYPQSLSFDLEQLDSASGGGYPRVITTSLGQRLRLLPAGRFQMGSSRAVQDRGMNEMLHPVEISQAFYMAEKEMTNGEYRRICDPDHSSGTFEGESLDGDDQPVVNVEFNEVAECLNKLSIADGLQPAYDGTSGNYLPYRPLRNGYRLPTEAEWEYAARAAGVEGEQLSFPWGEEPSPPSDRLENVADLAAEDVLPNAIWTYTDGFPVSAPVGSFAPNAAGLYDMGGNVAEWVQDFYEPRRGNADGEAEVDPLGPETGTNHVVRGPSWRHFQRRQLRLSYRDLQDDAREDVGFRFARNLQ